MRLGSPYNWSVPFVCISFSCFNLSFLYVCFVSAIFCDLFPDANLQLWVLKHFPHQNPNLICNQPLMLFGPYIASILRISSFSLTSSQFVQLFILLLQIIPHEKKYQNRLLPFQGPLQLCLYIHMYERKREG